MRILTVSFTVLLGISGCGSSDDVGARCEKAVAHVGTLVSPAAIRPAPKTLVSGCKQDKLTAGQLACIMDAHQATDLASCADSFHGRFPAWLDLATR